MTRIFLDPVVRRLRRMRKVLDDSVNALHFEADGEACDLGRRYYRAVFLTLTYRDVDGWQAGDMGDFTRKVRKWFEREGEKLRMAWVGETQRRGAVHYHAVLFVPRHLRMPCPDRCGWWPHGMTKVETARNPVGYLTKYASKVESKGGAGWPKGARLYGVAGLSVEQRRYRRLRTCACWLREALVSAVGSLAAVDLVKVLDGYLDRASGVLLQSPWRVELDAGGQAWAIPREAMA